MLCLTVDELLGYTNGERSKWEQWFTAQPPAAIHDLIFSSALP
jgi:hypothetical protein